MLAVTAWKAKCFELGFAETLRPLCKHFVTKCSGKEEVYCEKIKLNPCAGVTVQDVFTQYSIKKDQKAKKSPQLGTSYHVESEELKPKIIEKFEKPVPAPKPKNKSAKKPFKPISGAPKKPSKINSGDLKPTFKPSSGTPKKPTKLKTGDLKPTFKPSSGPQKRAFNPQFTKTESPKPMDMFALKPFELGKKVSDSAENHDFAAMNGLGDMQFTQGDEEGEYLELTDAAIAKFDEKPITSNAKYPALQALKVGDAGFIPPPVDHIAEFLKTLPKLKSDIAKVISKEKRPRHEENDMKEEVRKWIVQSLATRANHKLTGDCQNALTECEEGVITACQLIVDGICD